jgi:hypothetical protein
MHLSGEAVDTVADYLTIFILIFMPMALIYLFWMVHILPEKIAHKRGHPQADAIHTLCMLSLVFGGLLWPIAWIWAYSRPVLHKIAYGHDQYDHPEETAKDPLATRDKAADLAVAPLEPVAPATVTTARREGV